MGDPIKPIWRSGAKATAGTAPTGSVQTIDDLMRTYQMQLPQTYSATAGGITPLAQGELAGSQATTGGYNDLALQMLQQYGVPLADAQNAISSNVLRGSGLDAAQAAKSLEEIVNPEYAAIKNAGATQTANLLNSINLNGLSGGEQAAVERSLNQSNYATGNLGLDNATNAVQNAMQYGDRMAAKRGELSNYINTAGNFMGTKDQRPVNTAFGSLTQSPMLRNQVTADNAIGVGQGTLGNIANTYTNQKNLLADYNWKASDRWAASDIGKNMSSMCCFIFLEAYNGRLPWYVRVERDRYYRADSRLSGGYKRMAKWLVPLMRRSSIVRHLVNWTMVKPLSAVGAHDHCLNTYGKYLTPVRNFWFMIWRNTNVTC